MRPKLQCVKAVMFYEVGVRFLCSRGCVVWLHSGCGQGWFNKEATPRLCRRGGIRRHALVLVTEDNLGNKCSSGQVELAAVSFCTPTARHAVLSSRSFRFSEVVSEVQRKGEKSHQVHQQRSHLYPSPIKEKIWRTRFDQTKPDQVAHSSSAPVRIKTNEEKNPLSELTVLSTRTY